VTKIIVCITTLTFYIVQTQETKEQLTHSKQQSKADPIYIS